MQHCHPDLVPLVELLRADYQRRCGKLYLPPGARYYGCRHCHDLTYTSAQEAHKFDEPCRLLAIETGISPGLVKDLLKT